MIKKEIEIFKQKAIKWAANHKHFCVLNSCDFSPEQHAVGFGFYDFIIAVGALADIELNKNTFEKLNEFVTEVKNRITEPWIFGYLAYDVKNEIEKLQSENSDFIQFPDSHFFVPEVVIVSRAGEISIQINNQCKNFTQESVEREIEKVEISKLNTGQNNDRSIHLKQKINKEEYYSAIEKIKQHIFLGDVYEMNFCFEMFEKEIEVNPSDVYSKLEQNSPSPFSCFYSVNNKYLMSASMERFLAKRYNRIFSQPIKGTAPRSNSDKQDKLLKIGLSESIKERAENIMIVDLVRNDLSKIAKRGTVRVDELCKVYSYSHVHQMISTISCEMKNELSWLDAIKANFPMGSMTGAPKISAMRLIDKFENTKRGLYSGTVGYVDPFGNFDFNVVIRSLQYNADSNYLSLMVGSAITAKSNAIYEYEECLIKAKAMQQAISNTI